MRIEKGDGFGLNLPQTFGLVDKRTFLLLGEQFPFGTWAREREIDRVDTRYLFRDI